MKVLEGITGEATKFSDPELVDAAKTIVALAFRNGPLEELHAGVRCPTCQHDKRYSRISDDEMKALMKNAVDVVCKLLLQQRDEPKKWQESVLFASNYTKGWHEPKG